jgi:hypothetical protein
MKYKLFVVLLFLLESGALQSMQDWGRWHADQVPQPIGLIDISKEQYVRTGVAFRNLLLSDKGELYINNMYPIMNRNEFQLGSILSFKGIITNGDLGYVQGSPQFRASPVPYWAALGKFVQGVIIYLEAFGADTSAIVQIHDDYLAEGLVRNYQNLNSAKNALNNRGMAGVWEYMHTEFLYMFKECYNVRQKRFEGPFLSFILVSHNDMCESCERMMITMSSETVETDEPYQDVSYTVLVGSFLRYHGSRDRNSGNGLLKVVLQ